MMPLQRHGLVPIDDLLDRGCTLPNEASGPDFYIEDENRRALTALRNHRLLRYAKDLMGNTDGPALSPDREDVQRLGRLANVVTPAHRRQAGQRHIEATIQHEMFDHTASAGALE